MVTQIRLDVRHCRPSFARSSPTTPLPARDRARSCARLDLPSLRRLQQHGNPRNSARRRLRQAQRSKQRVPLRIKTRISLENSAQGLTVSTSFDNQAKDHRLRVLFPTGLESATHYADSIFEAAQRNNVPAAEWNRLHQRWCMDKR